MTRHSDILYFGHMLEMSQKCQAISDSTTWDAFKEDDILQLAIARVLSVIGEAARKVSPEGRSSLPALPWSEITGMRHKIVHDYFEIDVERLWLTASNDIPPLIELLENHLNQLEQR